MAQSVISNRYALEQRLGSGGMSTVFRATDRVLERTVAVKLLAEHLSGDDKFVARFRREALAVAKLTHPNVVQVYDTGVDSGRHYIVMEYVSGQSGAQILQTKGKVGSRPAVGIAVQACAGLDYAHRHGIVHRDVKPGNLMIIGGPATSEGGTELAVKLTDFGIARAADQTRLTQAGSVVGTAAYLSPEQARGEEATPASDVYALGVVTYQLLTGRLPFEGASLAELSVRRENERPLSPTAYDREIPDALSATVLRSLENERGRRFEDARSLAEALRRGLAGQTPPAGTATTGVLAGGASTAATRRIERTEAPSRPRRPPRPVITPGDQPPRRGTAARIGRGVGAVALMLLVAAIVAGVILLVTGAGQQTDLGQVLENSVDGQIQRLEEIIRENSN
jgi:serine/threonine-protein kinase